MFNFSVKVIFITYDIFIVAAFLAVPIPLGGTLLNNITILFDNSQSVRREWLHQSAPTIGNACNS